MAGRALEVHSGFLALPGTHFGILKEVTLFVNLIQREKSLKY